MVPEPVLQTLSTSLIGWFQEGGLGLTKAVQRDKPVALREVAQVRASETCWEKGLELKRGQISGSG